MPPKDCCVAGSLAELAAKAVRLARDEGGVRAAARAACHAGAGLGPGGAKPELFRLGEPQVDLT